MIARLSVHASRPTPAVALQVPKEIEDALEPAKDNDEETKRIGIELGTKMCRRLLDAGAPGLHMYTLNLERSALAILENLGLIKGRVHLCAGILHDLSRSCCLFQSGKLMPCSWRYPLGRRAEHLKKQWSGQYPLMWMPVAALERPCLRMPVMMLCLHGEGQHTSWSIACEKCLAVQVEQPLPWRAHPTQKRSAESVRYLLLAPGLLDVASSTAQAHELGPNTRRCGRFSGQTGPRATSAGPKTGTPSPMAGTRPHPGKNASTPFPSFQYRHHLRLADVLCLTQYICRKPHQAAFLRQHHADSIRQETGERGPLKRAYMKRTGLHAQVGECCQPSIWHAE